MNFQRIAKHLFTGDRAVRRAFPAAALRAIEAAILASETGHDGEIRFAVETTLDTLSLFKNITARERAIDVFSRLRVWDTERNNGVLIYLLLADRDVEIVADRGIHAKVGSEGWEKICRNMEGYFRKGEFEAGVVAGIQAISGHLQREFPTARRGGENELADRPVVL